MKKIQIIITLAVMLSLNAQSLFEVKDAQDSTVFQISNDGMRVFNNGDTLMVISSSEIKAFIDDGAKDRALSRSFSVTTSTSAEKLIGTNVFNVGIDATTMREGIAGDQYTNFSAENLFLGLRAGQETSTGVNNIFIGNECGTLNDYGDDNIYIGYQAGYRNDYASENIFIGNYSGYNNDTDDPFPYGSMNVFLGTYSGYSNIDGYVNTFLGYRSGEDSRGASENTYVGGYAGSNNNGNKNTALGVSALGGSTSGTQNTSIGTYSGVGNLTGSRNVFLGYSAGFNETGSDKLYIDNSDTATPLIWGDFATDRLSVNGLLSINNNNLALSMSPGSGTTPVNYIYQGVAGSTNVKDYAVAIYDPLWVSGSVWAISFLTTSDKRFKKNIVPISNALSKISQIDGVYFEWNDNMLKVKNNEEPEIQRDTSKQIGFIAQDIEKVFPEMVSTDGSGYKSVDYSKMSAALLEAVKEQQQQIDKQQQQIDMLIKEIETMKSESK